MVLKKVGIMAWVAALMIAGQGICASNFEIKMVNGVQKLIVNPGGGPNGFNREATLTLDTKTGEYVLAALTTLATYNARKQAP